MLDFSNNSTYVNEGYAVPLIIGLGYIGLYIYKKFYKSDVRLDPVDPVDPVSIVSTTDPSLNPGQIPFFTQYRIDIWNSENLKYLRDIENENLALDAQLDFEGKRSLINRMDRDLYYLEEILKGNPIYAYMKNPLNYGETLVFELLMKSKERLKDRLVSDPDLCRLIVSWKEKCLLNIRVDNNPPNLAELEMLLLKQILKKEPEFITGIINRDMDMIPVNDTPNYFIPFVDSEVMISLYTMCLVVSFTFLYVVLEPYLKKIK